MVGLSANYCHTWNNCPCSSNSDKGTLKDLFCVSVHLGGGLIGVLTVPLFSYDYGVVYNWDLKSAYVCAKLKKKSFQFNCKPNSIIIYHMADKYFLCYIKHGNIWKAQGSWLTMNLTLFTHVQFRPRCLFFHLHVIYFLTKLFFNKPQFHFNWLTIS